MNRLFVCFAALVGLTVLASCAPAQDKKAPPTPGKPAGAGKAADRDAGFKDMIGKPAPEFLGEFALNGKPTPFKDLKGKVVLVDFWAVWCGPCIATFPELRELHTKYKDKGLEIVGVTNYQERFGFDKGTGKLIPGQKLSHQEEQAMLKDFAAYHKLEHRLLVVSAEEHRQIGKDYKITGIPHVTIIDRKGNVQLVKVGFSPDNAKAIEEMVKKLLDDKA